MAKRRKWSDLGTQQQRRYLAAGRTGSLSGTPGLSPVQVRRYYESGSDLRRARGVHQEELRPSYAAPIDLSDRLSIGMGTTEDTRFLSEWRRSAAPEWLPRSRAVMGDDTAAILSQIGFHPRNWRHVEVRQEPGTDLWRMTVTPKVGYPRTVLLPDRESVGEVGRLLNANSRREMSQNPAEQSRMDREWNDAEGDSWEIDVDIYGTK